MITELILLTEASVADIALEGVIGQHMLVQLGSFIEDLLADVTSEEMGTISVVHEVQFVGKLQFTFVASNYVTLLNVLVEQCLIFKLQDTSLAFNVVFVFLVLIEVTFSTKQLFTTVTLQMWMFCDLMIVEKEFG